MKQARRFVNTKWAARVILALVFLSTYFIPVEVSESILFLHPPTAPLLFVLAVVLGAIAMAGAIIGLIIVATGGIDE